MRTLLFTAALVLGSAATAHARGAVTITFTAQQAPQANYAPNNVIAVWVEGPGGAYVRTLDVQALVRDQYLHAWRAASGRTVANIEATEPDVVSGATRPAAGPLTLSWNLMNVQNQVVPDGTYTIQIEMAQANSANAGGNRRGSFTFIKGPNAQNQTPTQAGFAAVTVAYDPTAPACGDAIVDAPETCDPGIASGTGACAAITCPATTDGCMPSRKLGSSAQCNVRCGFEEITECKNFDGCCLAECEGTDVDCEGDGSGGGGGGGGGNGNGDGTGDGDTVSGGCDTSSSTGLAFALPALGLFLGRRRRRSS